MKNTCVWTCGALAAMLMLSGIGARAAVVNGLYEASVPVPNQSAEARRVGLQQALAAVLVKVTGDREAAQVPALAKLAQDPSQFLQQYRYEQAPTAGTSAPPVTYYDLTRTGAPAIAPTGLLLSAKFDPGLVNKAVRAAQEPLWGQERPATLVWIAIDAASGKSILSAGGNPAIVQAMQAAAQQRGVPLIFPAMDAVDQQAIGVPDLAQNNTARIQQASQRYHPDAILIGTINLSTSGTYSARWQLTVGAESAAWNGAPGTLAGVTADGVQTAADDYAQWFAISPGGMGMSGITVSVTGIASVDAYAKVLAYLEHLTPVRSVQVARVQGQTVYFSLDTRGSVNNLRQAALLGGLLEIATPAATSAAVSTPVPAAASMTQPAAVALQFQYVPQT